MPTFKKVVFFVGPSNNQELWPTLIKSRYSVGKDILSALALSNLLIQLSHSWYWFVNKMRSHSFLCNQKKITALRPLNGIRLVGKWPIFFRESVTTFLCLGII